MQIELIEEQVNELKYIVEKEIKLSRDKEEKDRVDILVNIWESLNSQEKIYKTRKKQKPIHLQPQWFERNKKIV